MTHDWYQSSNLTFKRTYIFTYIVFVCQFLTWTLNKIGIMYMEKSISFSMWVEADKAQQKPMCLSIARRISFTTSFLFPLHPPFWLCFSTWKEGEKQPRCDGMDNEAVPWPSKHFLCLAWVFSSFTSTSAVAENKKHKTKKQKHQKPNGPYLTISIFFFFFYSLQNDPRVTNNDFQYHKNHFLQVFNWASEHQSIINVRVHILRLFHSFNLNKTC